nr:MAG TPA: hypothetical protein [Caudoviricetes sp.]
MSEGQEKNLIGLLSGKKKVQEIYIADVTVQQEEECNTVNIGFG